MLSIIEITIALIIGILWGLYLETKFLIITSIFLYVLVLLFCNKYTFISTLLFVIAIISCVYTKGKIEDFDTKYLDEDIANMKITIITNLEESSYMYKYHGKNKEGDIFLFYFSKCDDTIFEIGDYLQIKGEFNLPEIVRNRGGFDYRRYLNSNGIYGTIFITSFKKLPKEEKIMNLIYEMQNLVHKNFQKILSKEKSRDIKWNDNSAKQL